MPIFDKSFLQNNQCNYKFSLKKYFFDTNWRNDIFWYGEKIHDFCSKINNSKNLQNIKKIFAPWKSLEYQLSNDIRFSTQTQEMTEIWSNEKKVFSGGNIFFWLGVYQKNF